MTKILESLSAFEGKSINKLEMKNIMGGYAAEGGTAGGSRQVGCADGVSYWTFTYTSDISDSTGMTYCGETGAYTAN